MEEDKDIHSKVANNLEDQEKEQENPSTSDANNGSPSVTNETQSPAAEACAVAQPPKDDTNKSTDKNGATSSESTTAGVSTAGIALSDQVATDNSHVFDESWSKLHKDVIIDKIKGVIYGQAIGDAFGMDIMSNIITTCSCKYYPHTITCRTCYGVYKSQGGKALL